MSDVGLLGEDVLPLLLVLAPGDPHALDIGQRREDGASFPAHGIPAGGREHSGLDLAGQQSLELFDVPFREPVEHGVPASQNYFVVQVLPQVDVHLRKTVR